MADRAANFKEWYATDTPAILGQIEFFSNIHQTSLVLLLKGAICVNELLVNSRHDEPEDEFKRQNQNIKKSKMNNHFL